MSCLRAAVRAARFTTMLLFVSAAAWPATAPTAADLARCAAMTAPDARLACYDSLSAPPPASGATAAGAASKAPPATPTAAAPATSASAPALAPAPAATLTGAAPATPDGSSASALAPSEPAPSPAAASKGKSPSPGGDASADDPRNFGFSQAQVQAQAQAQTHTQAPPPGLQSLQARVANVFTDRMRNAFVLLDNGQMWEYQGDDGRLRPGDAITIKRGSLGSFIMLTQSRRSYHVTRTR